MLQSERRIFNEFSRKRELGAGAFGEVVLVEAKDDSHRQYAAKLVQRDDYLANVFHEADLQFSAQQLTSYVVPVVEKRPEGVLLEFYEGGDILGALQEMHQRDFVVDADIGAVERHEWTFYDSIAQQLLSAVTSLHLANIFHFDIKPDNILWKCDGEGSVQIGLADFGFAVRSGPGIQVFHDRVGNLLYSAPETVIPQGEEPSYTYKADVFSVGQTLFTIFTGRYLLRDCDAWTDEVVDTDALHSMIVEDRFQVEEGATEELSMQELIDSRLNEELFRGKLREQDRDMLVEMLVVDPDARSDVWIVLEKYYPEMYGITVGAGAERNAQDLVPAEGEPTESNEPSSIGIADAADPDTERNAQDLVLAEGQPTESNEPS